jgi:hypothetical protein
MRAPKSLASVAGPPAEIVYWTLLTTVVGEMIVAGKRQLQQGEFL